MKFIAHYLRLAALLLLAAPAAFANDSQGSASKFDIKLGGFAADYFQYTQFANPLAVGSTAGFQSAFAPYGNDGWTTIAMFNGAADANLPLLSTSALGLNLSMSLDNVDGRNGTWTIKNNDVSNTVTLDLVFAMYQPGASAAWLFDDKAVSAAQSVNSSWEIKFLTNNDVSSYANLVLFARDVRQTPFAASPVPEPEVYMMLLAGLGLIGFLSRRRRDEHDTFR